MVAQQTDLLLEDLSRRFGSVVALDRTNLNVAQGEMISLLGPSGCGKTTTLRIIAGFERPDTGRVCVGGIDLSNLPPNRRRLGMVAQDYSLFPHMNVAANVSFGLVMARRPKAEIEERVAKILQLVQLEGYQERFPHQLSGGQQQRVALARALVTNPSVLLLDEPLAALDKNLREAMQFELRRIQQQLGITTVMVTHDQEEALTLSDRIAVMKDGRILQVGDPREIYESPRTRFVSEFIGAANLFEGPVVGVESDGFLRISVGAENVSIRVPVPEGNPTTLAVGVRPEKLRLSESPPDEGNVLAARVTAHVFRGTYHAYEITISGIEKSVFVYQQSRSRSGDHVHQTGDAVWLAWHPSETIVFEPETE
jgi:putative spermidine/putrescine transport system ATP-binding protein